MGDFFQGRRHHHGQRREEMAAAYAQSRTQGGAVQTSSYSVTQVEEPTKHKKHEHMAEAAALGAGAFAMYEKHQVKVDPQNADKHKRENHIAEAVAVGSGGYGWHEHHKAKQDQKMLAAQEKKQHHHGHFK